MEGRRRLVLVVVAVVAAGLGIGATVVAAVVPDVQIFANPGPSPATYERGPEGAVVRTLPTLAPTTTAPPATTTTTPTATPAAARRAEFFAPTSYLNRGGARTARVDPQSAAFVDRLLATDSDHQPYVNTTRWSVPVYRVGPEVLPVRVVGDGMTATDPLQRAFDAVPLPTGALPASGTDGHVVVYSTATDTMWEMWQLRREGGTWRFSYGGRIDGVSRSGGSYPEATWWWGASATSIPLVAGLITLDDLAAGEIPHALAMAAPSLRQGVLRWPARRQDGTSTAPAALQAGSWLRLDPTLDLDGLHLHPVARMIAEALQEHGAFVRDTSGGFVFYGEDPTPTGTDPWARALGGLGFEDVLGDIPWNRLQVLEPPAP